MVQVPMYMPLISRLRLLSSATSILMPVNHHIQQISRQLSRCSLGSSPVPSRDIAYRYQWRRSKREPLQSVVLRKCGRPGSGSTLIQRRQM